MRNDTRILKKKEKGKEKESFIKHCRQFGPARLSLIKSVLPRVRRHVQRGRMERSFQQTCLTQTRAIPRDAARLERNDYD